MQKKRKKLLLRIKANIKTFLRVLLPANFLLLGIRRLRLSTRQRERLSFFYLNLSIRSRISNLEKSKYFNVALNLISDSLPEEYVELLVRRIKSLAHTKTESSINNQEVLESTSSLPRNLLSWFEWYRLAQSLARVGAFQASLVARENSKACAIEPPKYFVSDRIDIAAKVRALIEQSNLNEASLTLQQRAYLDDPTFTKQVLRYIKFLNRSDNFCQNFINEGSNAMSLFSSMIEGKEVAIVGPSQSDLHSGAEIDSMQVVIRIRSFGNGTQLFDKYVGRRVDVSLCNNESEIDYMEQIGVNHQLRVAGEKVRLVNSLRQGYNSPVPVVLSDPGQVFAFGDTMSGMRAVLTVLRARPKSVKLFNFDFYSGVTMWDQNLISRYNAHPFMAGISKGQFDGNLLWRRTVTRHDLIGNFLLGQTLYNLKFISGDQNVSKICTFSPETYSHFLEMRPVR